MTTAMTIDELQAELQRTKLELELQQTKEQLAKQRRVDDKPKAINIVLTGETFAKMRMRCDELGLTQKSYVTGLIEKDVDGKKLPGTDPTDTRPDYVQRLPQNYRLCEVCGTWAMLDIVNHEGLLRHQTPNGEECNNHCPD